MSNPLLKRWRNCEWISNSKTYKLAREKDGGGPRFIDLYTEDTILFKCIRAKVEKPFFDNENCNYFVEELHECVTSVNDITGRWKWMFMGLIKKKNK